MGRDRFSLPSTIREPKKYDHTRRGYKNLIYFFDKKSADGEKSREDEKDKNSRSPPGGRSQGNSPVGEPAKPRLTRKLRFLEMETKNGQRAIGEESQKKILFHNSGLTTRELFFGFVQ